MNLTHLPVKANKVSVVMAFHRVDKFLEDAIESILTAQNVELELIAVADGSAKLSSRDVAQTFAHDSRVLIAENPGQGRVAALNYGISLASHEFIGRMDSDDISMPDRLAKQAEYLNSHPDVNVVGGSIQLMDKAGNLGRVQQYRPSIKSRLKKPIHPPVAHPATMFRKSVWNQVGGYRENYPLVDDQDLWLRMLDRGEIHNLGEVVLHYRIHEDQLSSHHLPAQLRDSTLAGLENVLGEVPETLLELSSQGLDYPWLRRVVRNTNFGNRKRRSAVLRLLGDYVLRNWRGISRFQLAKMCFLIPGSFGKFILENLIDKLRSVLR